MLDSLLWSLTIVYALIGILLLQAFRLSLRHKRGAWFWHLAVAVGMVMSPFVLFKLALPPLPPGEEPGPGDGLVFFFLVPAFLIVLFIYSVFAMIKVQSWLSRRQK